MDGEDAEGVGEKEGFFEGKLKMLAVGDGWMICKC